MSHRAALLSLPFHLHPYLLDPAILSSYPTPPFFLADRPSAGLYRRHELWLWMSPEISIIVPLRNEGPNVGPLTAAILLAFSRETRPWELLLVDDGSTDDTWRQIEALAASDPRVRGLRHAENRGQSAALWTGFKASRAPILATLDGDLQNSPDDLPLMLERLARCDMVCAVRTRRMDTWVRRVSSRIARAARRLALGIDFRDTGCNLRVFRKSVLDTVPPFDGLHRFLPVLAHAAGATVEELDVVHHPRVAGLSKYGVSNRLWRGIRDLLMVRLFLKRQFRKTAVSQTPPQRNVP